MSKGLFVFVGILTFTLLSSHCSAQNECSSAANTYWTGYRCACRVGYKNQSNTCVPLTLLKSKGWVVRQPTILPNSTDYHDENDTQVETPVVNHNCYLPFEFFNGQGCVCLDGYTRINGLCQHTGGSTNNTCPANSYRSGNVCVCNDGFSRFNGDCVSNNNPGCGANSYDNGLGFCVCNSGFYRLNGTCVAGTPCPPNSARNAAGQCICNQGLTKYGDYCAKCPLGAIYDNTSSKCIYVCGENAQYSQSAKKCQCLAGFGIYDDSCKVCPSGYFVRNNYCVTCPVNSVYNSATQKCECQIGFALDRNGFCLRRCANNEVYNAQTGQCDCFLGLGRVGGVCQVCPAGTAPTANGNCGACANNQRLVDGRCICAVGFIPNELGICTECSLVPGAFLVNGNCATCPGDLVHNGQRCACPNGYTRIGTTCRENCKLDELVDENGLCYSCPINQVISEGRCVCRESHVRNATNGRCQLTCPTGQFKYQGRCALCPLNLQYRNEIGGCACPDGQYLNNFGVCQQVVLTPISCDDGFYFNSRQGCVACPAGCRTCTSANVCTSCSQSGFSVSNGTCRPTCGDGVIVASEQCDDGNNRNNDGCSSTCAVETLWTCSGQPSVCNYNGPAVCGNGRVERGEACDDGNTRNGDGCSSTCTIETNNNNNNTNQNRGLSLVGEVNTNINNVFVVLKTDRTFTFANENQMENFMKTNFPDSSSIPSVYCSQRAAPQLDTFDCLAIYSSGIPNQKYHIEFSYNYQGQSGFLKVEVDPLSSSFATRSLRNRSTRP